MAENNLPGPEGRTVVLPDGRNITLDDEEWELERSFDPAAMAQAVPADATALLALSRQAAHNHLVKKDRINIRLAKSDILLLKQRAAREGMPYQTLIASVLHKYATGI